MGHGARCSSKSSCATRAIWCEGEIVTKEEKALEALSDYAKDLEASLSAVRAAIAAFGRVPLPKGALQLVAGGKAKRRLSPEGKARIAAAARKRWAKHRREKKAAGR